MKSTTQILKGSLFVFFGFAFSREKLLDFNYVKIIGAGLISIAVSYYRYLFLIYIQKILTKEEIEMVKNVRA